MWFKKKMADEEKKNETPKAAAKAKAEKVDEAKTDEAKVEPEKASPEAEAEVVPQVEKPVEPDWKDRYARLLADFDNYKKRAVRDREDTYRYAESDILGDILPTCDNLALALSNAKNKDDDFVKGVQLVYDSLLKALKEHGAEPFDSVGKALDVEKMEAIATLPSADVDEGLVSNEAKRGWTLRGRTLRVAQVVVSSGKPEEKK